MIPLLYRYVGGALIFFLLLGGAYLKGRAAGKEVVQVKFDAYKNTAQLAYDRQVAETARIQSEWNRSKDREREIQARLQVVTNDGASLARRLRDYRARSCPLSSPSTTAGEPPETAGVPPDGPSVDQALGRHLEACARDAERLGQFQSFYQSLREATPP